MAAAATISSPRRPLVTKERAENMLFTAGYLWTYFQFGIKKGQQPLSGWPDLKGKIVAVNKARRTRRPRRPRREFGFEVQAFDYQTDARAGGAVGPRLCDFVGNTSIAYIAKQNPMFVPTSR